MYQGTLYDRREGAVMQAMAGIDLALWDVKSKALGQPVRKLLGGRFRDRLRVCNTAAALQFLAAVPNALGFDHCVEPSEISRRLIRNPIRLEGGPMSPRRRASGSSPDMAVVEKDLVR